MNPLWISLFLVLAISGLCTFICFLLVRRRRKFKMESEFRDDFTADLSVYLSEEKVGADQICENILKYKASTTDIGGQVLIEYINCITGRERDLMVQVFTKLGHLQRAVDLCMTTVESKRMLYLSWLLYIRPQGADEIFKLSTYSSNKLIRLIGLTGMSLMCDLESNYKALARTGHDLDDKHSAATAIMLSIGQRFGAPVLLTFTRSLELNDKLRRTAVIALSELKPIEHLDDIEFILENFGLLTAQESFNVKYRLKDLYDLLKEAA